MKKNALTLRIESKGYTLREFLDHTGFSLRWFRTHSQATAKRFVFLARKIEELEQKND